MAKSYVKFEIDWRQLRKDFEKAEKQGIASGRELIKQEAGFLARDLAFYTPPFKGKPAQVAQARRGYANKGKEDQKSGEKSVIGGVANAMAAINPKKIKSEHARRVLQSGDAAAIEAMLANWKGSPYQKFRVKPFSKELHRRARDHRGRVLRSQGILVVPWAERQNHLAAKLGKVGRAKAAFARIAIALGVKARPPRWIARHLSKVSGAATITGGNSPMVRIRASEPGVQHAKPRLKWLLGVRYKAMAKRFRIIARAMAKGTTLKPR